MSGPYGLPAVIIATVIFIVWLVPVIAILFLRPWLNKKYNHPRVVKYLLWFALAYLIFPIVYFIILPLIFSW